MPLISPEVALQGNGAGVEVTRFRWVVPAGQEVSAGEHRENLVIRYQCLDNAGMPLGPIQEQSFGAELRLRVPRFVSAFIGSAGVTRGAISFGPISAATANLNRTIGITALSTLPYRVEFDSENGQQLKRRRNADGGIDYTMRYGGTVVADGDRLVCPMTRAPMGTVEEFEVMLDRTSVARQPAGTYRDTVTITFTPRDVFPPASCALDR
jgi:spore coat protein U-like protein